MDYDLIVIGAGNAGQAAAGQVRAAGWRVAVIESRDVGGTCPLRGCVPKKVLVAAAEAMDVIARARAHHIEVGPARLDWGKLIARKQTFVSGVPADFEQSLVKRGIDVLHGRARFVGSHAVEVAGRRLSARKILVATGSTPRALGVPGQEHARTSDDVLELDQLPASVVFVGAGVIAMELGHVMARAGARVTILARSKVLQALDPDAVARLVDVTRAFGIDVREDAVPVSIRAASDGWTVALRSGGSVEAELVVNAAGRVADLADLDLAAAGVALEHGRPRLDAHLRSVSTPDVSFAGDANPGAPQLSPVATYEGRIIAHNLLGTELRSPNYHPIPRVVFSIPPLGAVGMSEVDARRTGEIEVKQNDMTEWRSARTYAEPAAYAKVLIAKDTRKILGAHLLGHGAPELIHAFALAIRTGLSASELAEAVYAYPTFHADLKFMV